MQMRRCAAVSSGGATGERVHRFRVPCFRDYGRHLCCCLCVAQWGRDAVHAMLQLADGIGLRIQERRR